MNYIIFDNDIYYQTQGKTGVVSLQQADTVFTGSPKDFSIAVIDTLQKQMAAPQKPAYKKDEVLSCAFSGEYVTQSEQTGQNLFQVVAIEKTKINDIYKHLGFENVRLVTAYGAALREFLKNNNLFSSGKKIIFVDHLGNQVLLTIFNNDVFTTPRRLTIITNRVVSELARSRENYRALNKDEKEPGFLIVTNNREIRDEVISSGVEDKDNVVLLEEAYPALAGLRDGKFFMHYLLPEQFIRLRKLRIVKKRLLSFAVMSGVLLVLLGLLAGSFSINKAGLARLKQLRGIEKSLDENLRQSYALKYRDIIRLKKKTNFPELIYSFINAVSDGYKIESISVKNFPSGGYRFEGTAYLDTNDKPFIPLVLPDIFKQAKTENILVKDNPGIRVIKEEVK